MEAWCLLNGKLFSLMMWVDTNCVIALYFLILRSRIFKKKVLVVVAVLYMTIRFQTRHFEC